jgi:hypothetical protein
MCDLAAFLQAGRSSNSSAWLLEVIGVLLFVVCTMPFAWALPAVAAYFGAAALLLQTAAASELGQHLLQQLWLLQLLLFCMPLIGLYFWEHCAQLAHWKAAAVGTCRDCRRCCCGNSLVKDRNDNSHKQPVEDGFECQTQQRQQQQPQPPPQQQQQHQQHPQQQGVAVLAPVTLPAASGAVPVPAALGYSSVFQRSVLAIKVQAPTTGEPEQRSLC